MFQRMLDEAGLLTHNKLVMMQSRIPISSISCVFLAGWCAFPTSCEDEHPADTQQIQHEQKTQDAPEENAMSAAGQEFVDRTLFEVSDMLRAYTQAPEITEAVRLVHELTEAYLEVLYAENKTAPDDLLYRCRVECKLADLRTDLRAYERARASYGKALETMDALPKEIQERVEVLRLRSSALAGLAYLAIVGKDLGAAGMYAEESMKIDKALTERLQPNAEAAPDALYEPVVRDLMGSYKLKGDILNLQGEPEEARDAYKMAVELAKKLRQVSPETARKLVVVQSALGDLERQSGNLKKAVETWFSAAKVCQSLSRQNSRALKAQAVRDFKALKVRIEDAQAELKSAGQEAQPAEVLEEVREEAAVEEPVMSEEEPKTPEQTVDPSTESRKGATDSSRRRQRRR